jgi:hypothetical protein
LHTLQLRARRRRRGAQILQLLESYHLIGEQPFTAAEIALCFLGERARLLELRIDLGLLDLRQPLTGMHRLTFVHVDGLDDPRYLERQAQLVFVGNHTVHQDRGHGGTGSRRGDAYRRVTRRALRCGRRAAGECERVGDHHHQGDRGDRGREPGGGTLHERDAAGAGHEILLALTVFQGVPLEIASSGSVPVAVA